MKPEPASDAETEIRLHSPIQDIQSLSSRPSAPDPIYVTSDLCWGFNTINWTAPTDATYYELYRSSISSFYNPTLIYSGPDTFYDVNVSRTSYFRAKACNVYGCSVYSAQVTATRYPGCP